MCSCQLKDVTLSGYVRCKGEEVSNRCEYSAPCGSIRMDYTYEEWIGIVHTDRNEEVPDQIGGPTDIGWWGWFGNDFWCKARCAVFCRGKNSMPFPPFIAPPYGFSCEALKGDYGY